MKVLALTDHDTMSGIPEAMEAARRYGIKIIPGVEISTIFYSRLLTFFLVRHDELVPWKSSILLFYVYINLRGF